MVKEGLWPGCGGWFRVCFYSGGKGGQRPFRGLARLLEIDVPEGASFSGSPKRGVPGMCRMVEVPLPESLGCAARIWYQTLSRRHRGGPIRSEKMRVKRRARQKKLTLEAL